MPRSKFYYNPKTLRYEKAGFPWSSVALNATGLMFTGCLFFGGLLYLHNHFVETDLEKDLRRENAALAKHKTIVEKELGEATVLLASLSYADRALHKGIFLTDPKPMVRSESYSKEILAGDFPEFYELVNKLASKTTSSIQKAGVNNLYFSKLYWPGKKDIEDIKSYPTLAPLPDFKTDQVACGFGDRINPFNKLLYEHNGIDLSAEKGTDILASGSGRVTVAGMNELPTGFGNYVIIDHGNGYLTRYAHLQQVKVYGGQKIVQGQVIGTIGMTGGAVAPHLHFEIIKNGVYCNPALFMIDQAAVESYTTLAEIGKTTQQALD
jgi:murein DD-endopeptidase MepM/ murein hydrolase activator NlpD